ncbi:metallophosphoesterase [Pseudonocardiaceae bacterium YIM PH 21723]|nr:metallophosphoesterase [Pseudonocardiaceae bacterium YIM PH 21723]
MTTSTAEQPTRSRRLTFITVIVAITLILFGVPWLALFPVSAQWPTAVTVLGSLVFVAAFVALPLLMVVGHTRHADGPARAGNVLLGVAWQLFAWSLLTLPVRLVLALAGVENPVRDRIVAVLLAVIVTALAIYGSIEALRLPRIKQVDVVLPRLGAAFDGFRLVMITDTHFGAIDRSGWSKRVVEAVNELRPDATVHAGDLADGTVEQRRNQVEPLGDVVGPKFYVTGNHEYLSTGQGWADEMQRLGWSPLRNSHEALHREGDRLVFAGIDDVTAAGSGEPGHGQDLKAALTGVAPDDPVVLLAHQPVQVNTSAKAGVDLQLSGHTHGGQMWPFHYLVRLQQPVVAGLSRHGKRTQLWTSRGTGFWGPPFRIFAPSEITLLILRRA